MFPKGAVAAGDGGGTGGGAHTHTADAHATHTWGGHTHTGGTTGTYALAGSLGATGGSQPISRATHAHAWSLYADYTAANTTTSASPGSTSYEPTWAKLAIVQNDSGAQNIQARHVAVWRGTLGTIPTGWALCDGTNSTVDMRGKFVKGANGVAEIGNTGGTAGHSHTDAAAHSHAYDHGHQLNIPADGPTNNVAQAFSSNASNNAYAAHNHTGNSSTATGTSGTAIQDSPSTADTQPAFRTVAYIVLLTSPATGLQQSLMIN